MTAGLKTTCGSRMLENFIAPYDAFVVEGLKRAGTVLIGKTNMDEFAMGSSNETSYFGPVKNPWNTRIRARRQLGRFGGGGGGAARAGRDRHRYRRLDPPAGVAFRHLRIEADLWHVLALRSHRVRVEPRYAGMFAQTAEDCALLLNAMAGHDARDSTRSTGRARTTRAILACAAATRAAHRPARANISARHRPRRRRRRRRRARASSASSARRRSTSTLPNVNLSVPVYYVIAPAEASSNLSRFDGVRYGHRAAKYADSIDMYKKSRAEGFGAEVKRRILVGTYVLSHGYYDAYYLKAQQVRRLIADDFRARLRTMRRDHGPDGAVAGVQDRRQDRRSRADVPERHLHDRRQPDRRARDLDSVRLRPARAAHRPADPGQLFPRGEDPQCRAPVPAGDRLACSAPRRGVTATAGRLSGAA